MQSKNETIILLHGLFFHGSLMKYMSFRLENMGYDVICPSYKTVNKSMDENAKDVINYIISKNIRTNKLHFVGHSLGGILIRKIYELSPDIFTGRIVTLGSPHKGSDTAKTIKKIADSININILGKSYLGALDGDIHKWKGDIELGSIAGTKSIGLANIIRNLEFPNDGTVSVNETILENATDYIEISCSHTSLVYSSAAFFQVDYFLQNGIFNHNKVK